MGGSLFDSSIVHRSSLLQFLRIGAQLENLFGGGRGNVNGRLPFGVYYVGVRPVLEQLGHGSGLAFALSAGGKMERRFSNIVLDVYSRAFLNQFLDYCGASCRGMACCEVQRSVAKMILYLWVCAGAE